MDLNDALESIDSRLSDINRQIKHLENEKRALLLKKEEYTHLVKQSMPSSSGGKQIDQLSDWNNTLKFEGSEKVQECLRSKFKLNSFRPLQLETINVTLSGKDCIVIMPTGGGKSLCFQLPACIERGDSVTLVISPLVSLIEDQLWILKALNINAQTLNSASSKEHVKLVHDQMTSKNNASDLSLLYVTPEKLAKSKMFMNKLQRMYEIGRFKRLVIDEVHCCSTYGHDFRPDYKFLNVMKNLFPNVCILGLTATATEPVIDDVKKILNIERSCVLFKASFNRPNIHYEIRTKPSSHAECMHEIANLISNDFNQQSGILYCYSQKECEQVAQDLLNEYGIKAESYHANMDSVHRSRVHEKWLNNEVHVIGKMDLF